MRKLTPITKAILIINVLAFILTNLIGTDFVYQNFGLFNLKDPLYRPYQFITHMFLHGNAMHLIFNMLGLAFFGPRCESFLGDKFIPFYFISGLSASLLHMSLIDSTGVMIGASGAIFGVFALDSLRFPNEVAYLFGIIGVRLKYLFTSYIIIELVSGIISIYNPNDHVAHFAHIGGALAGLFFYLTTQKGNIK